MQSELPNIVLFLPPGPSQISEPSRDPVDLDLVSETAWLGAIGWLDAGGPDTLAYDGGPEDAQGEWNEALLNAATEEVLLAGFDPDRPEIEGVIWEAAYDAGCEHRGRGREPLGPDSPFSAISVRWREMFPEADGLVARLRGSSAVFGGGMAKSKKEDALLELRGELWSEIFDHGFRWSSDEWRAVSVDIAVAMYEALTVDQMCRLVWCLRRRDVAGATGLLDLVTSHEKRQGHSYFNELALRRELNGEIRIHIAQLPNLTHVVSQREDRVSHVAFRRRTGARQRSSRGKAMRIRGSRRVASRSAGGGGSGDPDEPERALGPLSGLALALVFLIAFYGNWKLASAMPWKGTGRFLVAPFVLLLAVATVESVFGFAERLGRALRPIRFEPMSSLDLKANASKAVEMAQKQFERDSKAARETRRKAFAQAQKDGLSLREIGELVGLDHTRVHRIIRGE